MSVSRRKFLRGIGGVALAIPTLELTAPRVAGASGVAVPKRFVFSYAGVSTGRAEKNNSTTRDSIVPTQVGSGYDLPASLAALGQLNVRDHISVVSGLLLPWEKNGVMPPGGRPVQLHYNSVVPQIAGTRGGKTPTSPTCDQLVAEALGGTTPHRNLVLRAQVKSYRPGADGNAGRISWARTPSGGMTSVDPIVSPRLAFETLFKGFVPGGSDKSKVDPDLRRRQSVIDLVMDSRADLLSRLGASDRQRMERHFDELRDLELRLEQLENSGPSAETCAVPTIPATDPPVGDSIDNGCGWENSSCYDGNAAYSNEALRGELLSDLIAMAFACDLTRVVSYQLSFWKCYMNAYAVTGAKSDFHEVSHQGKFPYDLFAAGVGFKVKMFAQLVAKLRALPEVDGTSLLDHCAMALTFEGGHGLDPQTGAQHSTHSSENMTMLVAGRAGGLKSGEHIVAQGAHPAQVVASTMHAVGVKQDLGEVKGIVPALFA